MKIYFTAATTKDGNFQKQYNKIISLLKKDHQLTSGAQIVSHEKLGQDKSLGAKKIFFREKESIEKSDCVIAEVTSPSTGVGGEIVYALIKGKPVLALFYKEVEDKLSPMVEGNPSENLYLEHYDDNNINFVLERFLQHVQSGKDRKGKIIVIEGGDGSGKTTQAKLLVSYLESIQVKVKYYSFPQYYSSFHGRTVARFLKGEFGKLSQVSPYLISLAYALDRSSVREEMENWLVGGGYIVCNRYVTSSMVHQAAKLSAEKRSKIISWIDELEYRQFKMPRPDLVIYLFVPWKTGINLTRKKAVSRRYLKQADIAESNIDHRKTSEETYLAVSQNSKNWITINCVNAKNVMLAVADIQKKVIDAVKSTISNPN